MKTNNPAKSSSPSALAERKLPHFRSESKSLTHRHDRRKSREQLRRLDPAIAEDWG